MSVIFVDNEQEKEHNGHLWHELKNGTTHMRYLSLDNKKLVKVWGGAPDYIF